MEQPTLFILGAGASAPYGLPLGAGLTGDVSSFLASNSGLSFDEFYEQFVDPEGLHKLSETIAKSRTPTLDAFIEKNDKYAKQIKAGIAGVLLPLENRAICDIGFPDGDWISWLYHNRLKTSLEDFGSNQFSILSFNYDRIPEGLLARFIANTYEVDVLEALKQVRSARPWLSQGGFDVVERFVYMHGFLDSEFQYLNHNTHHALDKRMLQSVDPGRKQSVKFFEQVSNNLLTIAEPSNLDGNSPAQSMRVQIESASRIFILGLGYHESNLIKLGFTPDRCRELAEKLDFFGGTGFQLAGRNRDRVRQYFGTGFTLGSGDSDCLSFLQDYLD